MDFFSAAVARSIEKPLALFFEVYNKRVCLLLYVTYIFVYVSNSGYILHPPYNYITSSIYLVKI